MPSEQTLKRFLERGYSTCVAHADYDALAQELIIHFVKRGTYVYSGVDPDEAEGLINATSQGTYFNLYIRDRYPFERIG